jgi:septum site-determining protein MinC
LEDNIVIFKGKKNGISIVLNNEVEFETLKEVFSNKIIEAKNFFGEAKSAITFEGRVLDEIEEKELMDILFNETNLNISFIDNKAFVQLANKEKFNSIEEKYSKENMTLYHTGGLRSGQLIVYDGSVVIYGDVNPGAVVKATGNVVIFGMARGTVHAGVKGNSDCTISALCLVPIQLRIGSVITFIPKDVADQSIKESKIKPVPSYAFVDNAQIYIKPLD